MLAKITYPNTPANSNRLLRWERALSARLPIVGALRRAFALRRLVDHREDPRVVLILVRALEHPRPMIAKVARAALSALGNAAQLCVETGLRPEDDERAAVFLLVTGQLDAYFETVFVRDEIHERHAGPQQ